MLGRVVQVHECMMLNKKEAAGSCVASFASLPAEQLVYPKFPYMLLALDTCLEDYSKGSQLCTQFGIDERLAIRTASQLVRMNPTVSSYGRGERI